MARPFTPEMGKATAPRLHGVWWALILFAGLVAGWVFRDLVVVVATVVVVAWMLAIVLTVVAGMVAGLVLLGWALWSELLEELER